MSHFSTRGVLTVVVSLVVAATLSFATAHPIAPRAEAAEYKVKVTVKKSGYRSTHLLGRSAHICTPSGFGQKGRCYRRNAV